MDVGENSAVYVVDDDVKVRESLAELLHSIGMEVYTYATAESFLAGYEPDQPGCLLVDVCLPGMSGLELHEQLVARQTEIPWVVITAHADVAMAVKAMSEGACGFLEKPYRSHELLELIKKAVQREHETRLGRARRREILARFQLLSPREREVMEMVTSGAANKQAAKALGISDRTVEVHRANIMKKLRVDSPAELFSLAAEYRATCNTQNSLA